MILQLQFYNDNLKLKFNKLKTVIKAEFITLQ